MLAIISDLHVQQTNFDSIRYRRDGAIWQMGVHRNVKAGAMQRLFHMIDDAAKRRGSDQIHLVLAGDILELHRSPLWFMGPDNDVRPYKADPGPDTDGNPLRAKVRRILQALREEHKDVWGTLRARSTPKHKAPNKTIPLRVHYIPGNHDRLSNAWESVRRDIRDMLGMDGDDGSPFPTFLDFTAGSKDGDYGVRVRHGHEYDPANWASAGGGQATPADWERYLKPAFGDYVTIDVATRLATAFRARYAVEMRRHAGTAKEIELAEHLRQLYQDLNEFDDVRPASLLVDYLVTRMGADEKETFQLLRPVLRDAAQAAKENRFFGERASQHLPSLLIDLLPAMLENLSPELLEKAVRLFSDRTEGQGKGPAAVAASEVAPDRALIVAGHTHRPELVPLAGGQGETAPLYLNTGTWRTIIPAGEGAFGRLRAYTMVFCYNAQEMAKANEDGRRFETWTGHLTSGNIGPYDEPVKNPPSGVELGARQLRFDRLQVHCVERELNGAELEVSFGVDDQPLHRRWQKVRSGMSLSLNADLIPLDPRMDGEIWFHGVEVDWGDFSLDRDDLLPWAIDRLRRDPAHPDRFICGDCAMHIRGLGETHLVLCYAIV